ncbi:uncharacterized protein si:ch211-197h24.9 [Hoplias malabaricus]|uniref:uncharacterized protein si:ch211-197h24.9 n=1 Tax=Hoplias malabaricus TaxID=27720 RepID=UPI0034634DB5
MCEGEWTEEVNSRGHRFKRCKGKHVNLSEMRKDPALNNIYLKKRDVPFYPENVLFRASSVHHVTGESGLRSIFEDHGFKNRSEHSEPFLWWSLSVTDSEIADAEDDFLSDSYLDEWADVEQPFLQKFTTSLAFQNKSPYGNFCFTFRLRELLFWYARKFCGKSAPVFRVLDTRLYKQEISYSVLVHPPHVRGYGQYPRLPRKLDALCGYSQGQVSWRCQAPSHALRHELNQDREGLWVETLRSKYYYVWDNVAIAFHMDPDWTLRVSRQKLYNNVSVCKIAEPKLLREPDTPLNKQEADEILGELASKYGL